VTKDLVKLARGFSLALAAAIRSALVAALRLIGQSSLGEEGLLAGREPKFGSAVTAGQRHVCEAHL
jgi:hypothetical protein